jgi:hypothetical protein
MFKVHVASALCGNLALSSAQCDKAAQVSWQLKELQKQKIDNLPYKALSRVSTIKACRCRINTIQLQG